MASGTRGDTVPLCLVHVKSLPLLGFKIFSPKPSKGIIHNLQAWINRSVDAPRERILEENLLCEARRQEGRLIGTDTQGKTEMADGAVKEAQAGR